MNGARGRSRWLLAGLAATALAASGCSGTSSPDDPSTTWHTFPSTARLPQGTGTPSNVAGASPFGAHWNQARIDSFSPYLKQLGGSVTYYEATWCKLEPTPGQVKWQKLDRVIQTARRFDITLMVKIRTGTCWATTGTAQYVRGHADKTESSMPRSLAQYTRFVKELVARAEAGGVNEFAIENEVNSPSYWSGTPADYVHLVDTAARAIRSTAPHAVIADAGLSSTSYGYGIAQRLLDMGEPAAAVSAWNTYYARRFGTRGGQLPEVADVTALRDALSGSQGRRNLDYLRTTQRLLQTGVVDVRQIHFYEKWNAVPILLSFLRAETPSAMPIEAWEVGSYWVGAPTDETLRSDEMVKTLALLVAGGVKRAIWLPLASSPQNRRGEEVRYGLLDPDGQIRPAGVAAQALVTYSRDAAPRAVSSDGLRGIAFDRGGRVALVVWAARATVHVEVGPGARAGAVDAGARPSGTSVSVGSRPEILLSSRSLADLVG